MPKTAAAPTTFTPALQSADPVAAHWLRQVTVRLRREVCWIWHERGLGPAQDPAVVPPTIDRALDSLDRGRYDALKREFFVRDETARYLSEQLDAAEPPGGGPAGSFGWAAEELALDEAARFVLALALSTAWDSACGSVIGACLNDTTARRPTLELAQRLWDRPAEALQLADPAHVVFRSGLVDLSQGGLGAGGSLEWTQPLAVSAIVARRLLDPLAPAPETLAALDLDEEDLGREVSTAEAAIAGAVRAAAAHGLCVVPVIGPRGADYRRAVARVAALAGRSVREVRVGERALRAPGYAASLAASAWLGGHDLFIDERLAGSLRKQGTEGLAQLAAAEGIPVRIYVALEAAADAAALADHLVGPRVPVASLSYPERVALWTRELGGSKEARSAVESAAHRFRFERGSVARVSAGLKASGEPVTAERVFAACKAEVELDFGELADRIIPRFSSADLILAPAQARVVDEIRAGIRNVSRVHHEWGTARAWDEAGLAVLLAGPPGTGKTMTAEVLARDLDLPLYRIDLSQVVNKYVGETEKNLKRLFDAAESADVVLFFDEADAVFGRRTQVKDAHDRYANLEVSYLLGRMERAKGLTILATNRKRDLDEAFLRRLRYVVDYAMPGIDERERIWRGAVPPAVDASELEFRFLAERFRLSGGHIRSAMFNACLQSAQRAATRDERKLRMDDVLIAVWRELRKAERTVSLDAFEPHGAVLRQLVAELEAR